MLDKLNKTYNKRCWPMDGLARMAKQPTRKRRRLWCIDMLGVGFLERRTTWVFLCLANYHHYVVLCHWKHCTQRSLQHNMFPNAREIKGVSPTLRLLHTHIECRGGLSSLDWSRSIIAMKIFKTKTKIKGTHRKISARPRPPCGSWRWPFAGSIDIRAPPTLMPLVLQH